MTALIRYQAAVLLAVTGVGYVLARCQLPGGFSALASVLAAGLVTAVVCLLVGSAAATLCNPPLIRHPAVAFLGTTGAVVLALVAGVSPANAALRGPGSAPVASDWLTGLPLLVALALVAVSWLASTLLAGRRS